MNSVFDRALADTLAFEGGYVNNPADRGGPTNMGITQATADANGYVGNMKDIPLDLVTSIYKKSFWEKPGLEPVSTLLPELARLVFDTGVNMGPKTANMMLQEALNIATGESLTVDGILGPKTLEAAKSAYAPLVKDVFLTLRRVRYIDIVRKDPSQRVFLKGWFNRVRGIA